MKQQLARLANHQTLDTLPPILRNQVTHWRDLWEPLREGHRFERNPEAAGAATALETEAERRASDQIVAQWLATLSAGVAGNLADGEYTARVSLIINVVGARVPAFCWTQETLWAALKRMKWFPTVYELMELFEPIISEHQFAINTLWQIANATPITWHAESTAPYPVQMPPPERVQKHQIATDDPDYRNPRSARAVPPKRTIEQQLDALKQTP